LIGQTVSHYRITGRLGVGGMGIVYDAEDSKLGRSVALKFLTDELATDPDATRRLRREAQMLAQLNHPNICTIYEIDEYNGRAFLVMERLAGTNLKLHIARKTLDTPEVLDIAIQIAGALDRAHGSGIVHRDIKPGNIFVAEGGHVKVLDFGMAKAVAPDTAVSGDGSTIPGRPIGTANYMAPERILQMPLDGRCDLFSLGVVMYEMATGRLPFAGATPAETVGNILDKDPQPLTALAPRHPDALNAIVTRLTAKLPDDRYAAAEDVLLDLRTLADRIKASGWRNKLLGRFRT